VATASGCLQASARGRTAYLRARSSLPSAAATAKHGEQVRADGNTNNNGPAETLVAAVLTDPATSRLAEPLRDDRERRE